MSQPRSSLVSSRSASIGGNEYHQHRQQYGPRYRPSEDHQEYARQDEQDEQGDHPQHKQHDQHQHMEDANQSAQSKKQHGHYQRGEIKPVKRLGQWFKLSMVLSLLALASSVAFISWLWWSPSDDHRWRQWVVATNRLQLSVTITGVIVRAAVGTLAASTTAMLASVAVERSGVRAHAIAQVSMARFATGGGFISLSLLALRDSMSGVSVRLLLGCLIVTTLGLQLTSTLLVNDLEEGQLVFYPQNFPNAYSIVGNHAIAGKVMMSTANFDRYWEQKPRLAETFAEYAEPDLRLEADGLDDTGPVVRAFLPIVSQEARETVSRFHGMARVYESRVVCVRPTVSEMRPCRPETETSNGVCGVIQLDDSAAVAAIGADALGTKLPFTCELDLSDSGNTWQLCKAVGNSSLPSRDGLRMSNIEWTLRNETIQNPFKSMWLLWNTGEIMKLGVSLNTQSYAGFVLKSSAERSGPWMNMTFRLSGKNNTISTDLDLKMSLCTRPSMLRDIAVEQLNISASRSTSGSGIQREPTYSLNTDSQTYDTSAVRRQLGAVKSPLAAAQHREIITISPEDFKSSLREARDSQYGAKYSPNFVGNGSTATPFLGQASGPRYINFCSDCSLRITGGLADMFYLHMLNDIIKETNSPALALQAVWMAVARAVYYEYMNLYTPENDEIATITSFHSTILPQSRRGYLAVMTLLVAFLSVFAVVCVLFSSTQFSLPDNAWHTVAQISESAETSSILSRARVKSDHEVCTMCKELQDEDEEDRFVVRRGVFVRASSSGTAVLDDQEAPFLKAREWYKRQ